MTIEIAEYCTQWTEKFAAEREVLAAVIGAHTQAIEHIGSTAVPGLAAKPIIDIMPGLRSDALLDACVEPLKSLGYTYIPEYETAMPFRRFFKKALSEQQHPGINVHIVAVGTKFWHDHLRFRDMLRLDPDLRARYEALKRDLATQFTDTNDYAGAKTDFIVGALSARSDCSSQG